MVSTKNFPFQSTIEVVFRDTDAMGHVNNAVYLTYIETVRTRFFFQHLDISTLPELPMIVAGACCNYRAPAHYGDLLTIGLGISRIGNKSFEIIYQITNADGRLIADANTVMVAYDYARGETIPIPAYLNNLLQSFQVEE